jgi:hypothetical protein
MVRPGPLATRRRIILLRAGGPQVSCLGDQLFGLNAGGANRYTSLGDADWHAVAPLSGEVKRLCVAIDA